MSDLSWDQRIRNLQQKLGLTMTELTSMLYMGESSIYTLSRNPSKIIQEKIIELEQYTQTQPITEDIEQFKQNLILYVNKNKPIIYETQLLTDEQKIKLIRIINDFVRNLNEFEF
jgi:hypothetical protein